MCVTLYHRGRLLRGVSELRETLGWNPPCRDGYPRHIRNTACLCAVDLDKLARLAGWQLVVDPDDDAAWHVREAP